MCCGALDVIQLSKDRDLIWAEAVAQFKAGATWWLETPELERLAEVEQEAHYKPGPWDMQILEWIKNPVQRQEREGGPGGMMMPVTPFNSSEGRVTVGDVLLHAIGKKMDHWNRSDEMSVANCLKHAGWKRDREKTGKRSWFYTKAEGE